MYWVDKTVDDILEQYKEKIAKKEPIIIRDEKTASGRVHVGSLRGVAIHGLISEVLTERGIPNTYLFEINDFDPMDGIPVYLDQEVYKPYLGRHLCDVPSPDGKTVIENDALTGAHGRAKNFPEFYAEEFAQVIQDVGFKPTYYRSSDVYKSGKYNECIRLALIHADKIREIYKRISGSVKEGKWLPINMKCEKCQKISTTLATEFDGEKVKYVCRDLDWTNGCGFEGEGSPFDGNAKLPWKVEWAAKFSVMGVDVEGGGKDHCTKGGSRDIADTISREVFNRVPPFNVPYEFFQVGGKKMSSSKGAGSSSREVADLLPSEILRLLLLQKEPQRVIEFMPDGDTVPILFDSYDKFAQGYFAGDTSDYSRMFKLIHSPEERDSIKSRAMPRFSQIAFLSQMQHLNIEKETEHLVGKELNDDDKKELNKRIEYAKRWITTYAPEDYKFEIQETVPEVAKSLSDIQKAALKEVLAYVETAPVGPEGTFDGQEMHTALHATKEKLSIEPREFFEAIYLSILGKKSGPKAGWFLSVMNKDFLIKRLGEVTV
jgi:lysyl-tRNA synthetase class 1